MEDQEKKERAQALEQEQISQLRSGNSKTILDTLKRIRTKAKLSLIPEVFNLMLITEEDDILHACSGLLNDIKSKEVQPYIIEALKNPKFDKINGLLLSSCWQSGLDYHEHIELFTEIFISADYISAIEAFTVIEESVPQCSKQMVAKIVSKLKNNDMVLTPEKEALQNTLIEVVEDF